MVARVVSAVVPISPTQRARFLRTDLSVRRANRRQPPYDSFPHREMNVKGVGRSRWQNHAVGDTHGRRRRRRRRQRSTERIVSGETLLVKQTAATFPNTPNLYERHRNGPY